MDKDNIIKIIEEEAKSHEIERYRTTRDKFLAEKCKWSYITGAKSVLRHIDNGEKEDKKEKE